MITRFDPWQSSQCTCPLKLTFNPYTGCSHNCVYCYAQSYIPRFTECRPKKTLFKRLEHEAQKLNGETISIANSSDPYPQMEGELGLTRKCLQILSRGNCRIQIITKSHLVTRDINLLREKPSTVALTITTEDEGIAKKLEPHAPKPSERLKALETLIQKGIPVSARIDPIIPLVNDNPKNLIKKLAEIGVKHVTTSTYKAKPDSWKRFATAMPKQAQKLKPLYWSQGEHANGCILLPRDLRLKILTNARSLALSAGVKFAVCREGLSQLNTACCDGSWLLPRLET
ncbi:radical SAM protein [Candidatus Bathyarchaeota archaeon]|nr:radical SAM protein [Candidatus Bathyarchaeota archaeon]